MTIKDTISSYLSKGKAAEIPSTQTTTSADSAAIATAEEAHESQSDPVPTTAEQALKGLKAKDEATYPPAPAAGQDVSPAASTSTSAATPSMSRSASMSARAERYKTTFLNKLPAGQFDIENATAVPLNISLNQVGPLYYDTVRPGETFSRQTGKVWFTIEIRLHTGPASEYSKWSVAWPIMLMAGPSAAAISLAAIPIAALVTGSMTISALVSLAVQGVSAATSSAASALGIASKLPFASKYKAKAIGAAKGQALEAQKFAGTVMNNIQSKGGLQGIIDDWKKRGAEPAAIEWAEKPSSVHDITGADMAEIFDTDGPGPKGWKKNRWQNLRTALLECKLVDRCWYAGRAPVLQVTGGPKVVQIDNPLPKHAHEKRTILEVWPLRLEKVVLEDGEAVTEELARGDSRDRDTSELVTEAAEAMRE